MIGVMQTVSFAEADRDLGAVIDMVVADRVPVAIIRADGVDAVLIAAGEWAAIEAVIGSSPVGRL